MKWRNFLSAQKVLQALRIEACALGIAARHGLPDFMPQFLGGLGDELLLTCVAHEWKRRRPDLRIWQVSPAAELLRGNADYHRVFSEEDWPLRYAHLLDRRRVRLRYSEMPEAGERETPVTEHILTVLCRGARLTGEIELRPYCHLSHEELRGGTLAARQVSIHSVGVGSHGNVMRNKIWFHERLQAVVDDLRRAHPGCAVVQLGVAGDPPLVGVIDRRGRTSLRQSAAILARSECFVGTSGLLSHLARAVECRAVVVYGGREHAWQTGYVCNENLESHPPCAPCWRWNSCERNRECLEKITVPQVLAAIEAVMMKRGLPLETQRAFL